MKKGSPSRNFNAASSDSKMTVDEDRNKHWKNAKGQLHRLDGPAIEWADRSKEWYIDGKRHRLDGPAIERANGTKSWWVNDKLHRLDGPAVEGADGWKEWYIDGKRHRLDGPAIERANGTKSWWVNDKLHRLDGPAVERADGWKEWYIDGKELTEKEFNRHPGVLAFQRGRQAELEATEKAEAKRKLDDMHKIYGAFVRDFHRKIGGLQ